MIAKGGSTRQEFALIKRIAIVAYEVYSIRNRLLSATAAPDVLESRRQQVCWWPIYSKGCNSENLFSGLAVSGMEEYQKKQ